MVQPKRIVGVINHWFVDRDNVNDPGKLPDFSEQTIAIRDSDDLRWKVYQRILTLLPGPEGSFIFNAAANIEYCVEANFLAEDWVTYHRAYMIVRGEELTPNLPHGEQLAPYFNGSMHGLRQSLPRELDKRDYWRKHTPPMPETSCEQDRLRTIGPS